MPTLKIVFDYIIANIVPFYNIIGFQRFSYLLTGHFASVFAYSYPFSKINSRL